MAATADDVRGPEACLWSSVAALGLLSWPLKSGWTRTFGLPRARARSTTFKCSSPWQGELYFSLPRAALRQLPKSNVKKGRANLRTSAGQPRFTIVAHRVFVVIKRACSGATPWPVPHVSVSRRRAESALSAASASPARPFLSRVRIARPPRSRRSAVGGALLSAAVAPRTGRASAKA